MQLSDNNKKILLPVLAVICFAAAFFLWSGSKNESVPYDRDTLVEISGDGISAQLPQGTSLKKADGVPFYCVWQDGLLAAGYDTDEQIAQSGHDASMSLEGYAEICAADAPTDVTVQTDENGNVCFSYEINSNGTPLYYYVAFLRGTDRFWTCNFVCSQDLKDEYAPYFSTWASLLRAE